jgi:hypothetical protein
LFISLDRSMVTGAGFGTCLNNVCMFTFEVQGEHSQTPQPPPDEQREAAEKALSTLPRIGWPTGL